MPAPTGPATRAHRRTRALPRAACNADPPQNQRFLSGSKAMVRGRRRPRHAGAYRYSARRRATGYVRDTTADLRLILRSAWTEQVPNPQMPTQTSNVKISNQQDNCSLNNCNNHSVIFRQINQAYFEI